MWKNKYYQVVYDFLNAVLFCLSLRNLRQYFEFEFHEGVTHNSYNTCTSFRGIRNTFPPKRKLSYLETFPPPLVCSFLKWFLQIGCVIKHFAEN